MAADHWLTGIGLGSYGLLSPIYLYGFPENIHFFRAHNEYLELVIELGIPMALLLFAWIFYGVFTLFFRLRRLAGKRDADLVAVALGIACVCGLLNFLFHGLADFGWRLPVNLVYATTLLAVALSCLHQAVPEEISEEELS